MKLLKKIYKDTFLVFFLTVGILILSYIDNSGREVVMFDLSDYFSKFNNDLDNVEEIQDEITEDEIASDNTDSELFVLKGTSSHYANKFHGKMTANGEIFDMNEYSAAHKKLPFGTILKIVNQKNKKTTLVRVNDRGPFVSNRIIDLSYSAAKQIGDMGLPKIKAISFDLNSLKNTDPTTQYLAFSEDKKLQVFEKNAINVSFKTDDFTKAVKAYRGLKSKSNINNVFLFVPASEEYYKNTTYYIGNVNSSVLFAQN